MDLSESRGFRILQYYRKIRTSDEIYRISQYFHIVRFGRIAESRGIFTSRDTEILVDLAESRSILCTECRNSSDVESIVSLELASLLVNQTQ